MIANLMPEQKNHDFNGRGVLKPLNYPVKTAISVSNRNNLPVLYKDW